MASPLGLGIVGCGDFGLFCMDAFNQLEEVRLAAAADVRPEAVKAFTDRFGIAGYERYPDMLADDSVALVHVATPPSSHHEIVLAALRAGKHVLCEKPLAMNRRQAFEMLAEAEQRDLICPVNFVLRYNPVTDAVKRIIDSGALGKPLMGRLTNLASDHKLHSRHWFWDEKISGRIFVEHGVHFFDLYRYWLGPAEVTDVLAEKREGTNQEDRVMCSLRHDSGTIASHYHGFDQVLMMDRTDNRIVCELGDIEIDGWVPLTLRVHAATDDEGAKGLAELCPGAKIRALETYEGEARNILGRGAEHTITQRVEMTWCPDPDKEAVYARGIQELLADQIAYIRDPGHQRVVTEENGRAALALAEQAARLAQAQERSTA